MIALLVISACLNLVFMALSLNGVRRIKKGTPLLPVEEKEESKYPWGEISFNYDENDTLTNYMSRFLDAPIDRVEVGTHFMGLFHGEYSMKVWIENKFYAYCKEVVFWAGDDVLFKSVESRPSEDVMHRIFLIERSYIDPKIAQMFEDIGGQTFFDDNNSSQESFDDYD